jgi:hypothetical protein
LATGFFEAQAAQASDAGKRDACAEARKRPALAKILANVIA